MANEDLERRVTERTAELVKANQDLQAQIAERQRMEAELLTERNLLRTLIDNVPDQIYVKDTASRFVLANTATMHAAECQRTRRSCWGRPMLTFSRPSRPRNSWPTSRRFCGPANRWSTKKKA